MFRAVSSRVELEAFCRMVVSRAISFRAFASSYVEARDVVIRAVAYSAGYCSEP